MSVEVIDPTSAAGIASTALEQTLAASRLTSTLAASAAGSARAAEATLAAVRMLGQDFETSHPWVGTITGVASPDDARAGTRDDVLVTPAGAAAAVPAARFKLTGLPVVRALGDRFRDTYSVRDTGAVGDGITDDRAALQLYLDAMAADPGGHAGRFPRGAFRLSGSLIWPSNVYVSGAGRDVTVLKLLPGVNADVIRSAGFEAASPITRFGLRDLTVDGNYFENNWNAANALINNTRGFGFRLYGYACEISVRYVNVAEIGFYIDGPAAVPPQDEIFVGLEILGKISGKEGIVLRGPNDYLAIRLWQGLGGIQPRPTAETTFAVSTLFPGDPVDGIVVDGDNIEFGTVHAYANWSGTGFRTRGTNRIEGTHLISESNRAQVRLSQYTYGGIALVSLRNVAMIHPNWTAPVPVYTKPDPNWDAITMDNSRYEIAALKIARTITGRNRVPGTTGLVINGSNNIIKMTPWRSTPTDPLDADYPHKYSGDELVIYGAQNIVDITSDSPIGTDAILVAGDDNIVRASVIAPVGTGLRATGRENDITATVKNQVVNSGGYGAAFDNSGVDNSWDVRSNNNAVPYKSYLTATRADVRSVNNLTRTFVIGGGAITVTHFDRDEIVVDTDGTAAAGVATVLSTINGVANGQRITLRIANNARTVNVTETGNIRLAGASNLLNNFQDRLVLISDGTNLVGDGYSDNS